MLNLVSRNRNVKIRQCGLVTNLRDSKICFLSSSWTAAVIGVLWFHREWVNTVQVFTSETCTHPWLGCCEDTPHGIFSSHFSRFDGSHCITFGSCHCALLSLSTVTLKGLQEHRELQFLDQQCYKQPIEPGSKVRAATLTQ